MKALTAGLALALLATPTLAAEPAEAELYHWGECAAVGALFEAAVGIGATDPRITSASSTFADVSPRMEAYANAIADRLGEERANAVRDKILQDYDSDIALWGDTEDRDAFMLETWGKTMDRCLKEATALPVPGQPVT